MRLEPVLLPQRSTHLFFAAGLFGNLPEAVLTEEIYTKDQPHFYHFAEPTTRWQKLQNP